MNKLSVYTPTLGGPSRAQRHPARSRRQFDKRASQKPFEGIRTRGSQGVDKTQSATYDKDVTISSCSGLGV
jgi:hypothetical protein